MLFCGDLTILLLGLAFHCFYYRKQKSLCHSLSRPSRSDFVQSQFVCDFIGEINQISPPLVEEIKKQTQKELDGAKKAYIRLERISFQKKEGCAKLKGVVKDYDYNGIMTKYRVEVMGQELRVVRVNDGLPFYELGQELLLFVEPDDIMQF